MAKISTPKRSYLTKLLLVTIIINFIPNKIKTLRDRDPSWLNDDIKNKIKLKHKLYHRYLRHQNNADFAKLEDLRNEIDNLISKSKEEYYQNINRRVSDPSTSSKIYSSIMKRKAKKFMQYLLCSLTMRLSVIFRKNQIFPISFFKINVH